MAAFMQLSSSFIPKGKNNLRGRPRALQLGHRPKRSARKVRRVRLPVCTAEEREKAAFAAPTASSFTWAVGQSREAKIVDAVKDAVARASFTLERQGVRANLAIVFVKSRGELTPDDEVRRVLPTLKTTLAMRRALSSDIVVFGCTTANYVNDENVATVSVALASFPEGTIVRPFEIADKSSFDIDWKQKQWHDFVGMSPNDSASSTSPLTPKGTMDPTANLQLFMLQHPDFEGMLDLLSGLDFAYPGVRKFGAMAGRAHALDTIYLFGRSGLVTKGVVGLAFSSPDVHVDVTVAQGARGVGPMMEVTEVRDGNEISKVKEIGTPGLAEAAPMVLLDMWASTDLIPQDDRKRAREYLLFGVEVQKVTDLAFSSLTSAAKKEPAGKKTEDAEKDKPVDMVIRKVVGFNDGTRSLAVEGGGVRLGSRVQFQVRDEEAACSELVLLFNRLMLEGSSKAMEGMSLTGAVVLVDNERGEYLYGKLKADSDREMYVERFPVPLLMLTSEGQIGPLPAGGLLGTAGNTFTLSASALYVSFYSRNRELKQGDKAQPES